MARKWGEGKETGADKLVRRQYKVLFRLLVIKDERKSPNPKTSAITNTDSI